MVEMLTVGAIVAATLLVLGVVLPTTDVSEITEIVVDSLDNVTMGGGSNATNFTFELPYLIESGSVVSFNESRMNLTIDDRANVSASNDTVWVLDDIFIHNVSDVLTFNESRINETIIALDTNESGNIATLFSRLQDVNLSVINLNESLVIQTGRINLLNSTIINLNNSLVQQIGMINLLNATIINLNESVVIQTGRIDLLNVTLINLNGSLVQQTARIDLLNSTIINLNVSHVSLNLSFTNLTREINYTYVSGNDIDTDVTGEELENLTDDSNADNLHDHHVLNSVEVTDTPTLPGMVIRSDSTTTASWSLQQSPSNSFIRWYDPDNSNYAVANSPADFIGFGEDKYIQIDIRNTGGLKTEYANFSVKESQLNTTILNNINFSSFNLSSLIVENNLIVSKDLNISGHTYITGDLNVTGKNLPEYMSLVANNPISCDLFCSNVPLGGYSWNCSTAYGFTGTQVACSSTTGYRNCFCQVI